MRPEIYIEDGVCWSPYTLIFLSKQQKTDNAAIETVETEGLDDEDDDLLDTVTGVIFSNLDA